MRTRRAPPPARSKRSIPEVDALPPRVREQLSVAAMTASRVHTEALDRVEKEYAEIRSLLRSMRWLLIATLALMGLLSVFVAVEATVRSHQIESLDRRVLRLERVVFPKEVPND